MSELGQPETTTLKPAYRKSKSPVLWVSPEPAQVFVPREQDVAAKQLDLNRLLPTKEMGGYPG